MPPQSQFEVVRDLIAASNQGREFVPLVGAGFSIESGIPALSALTQYLAKVEHYIRNGLYNPNGHIETYPHRQSFRKDPSRYLRNFGWPDPNQLDSDLWAHVAETDPSYRGALHRVIQEELVEDIRRLDEELAGSLAVLRKASKAKAFLASSGRRKDLRTALGKLWSLKGNWKTLLAHLTHATPDYADTLFHELVQHRQPGTSHRFLALLAPILGIRLCLTTNFDNLLEEALRIEGHLPMVYEISHESPLPHSSLIRKGLSVVKLHGGAFGLRVGESLDYPLDEESKARLRSYLPDRPVLLVMGLGGWDRRITDLVELVVAEARERTREKDGEETLVYWMHFEPSCPPPVKSLAERYPGAISPVRIQDPGALLLELYSRITSAHPPAARPYHPYILRPIDPQQPEAMPETDDAAIQFFLDDPSDYGLGSSRELARLAAHKAATHTPIWIDVEAMHTITDVVVEIFRQLRKHDPSLLPIVLPVGLALDDKAWFEKPIRRIYDALSRGQYLLAFNAVNSFGRPPTSHHSTPALSVDPDHRKKETMRQQFLSALVRAAHRRRDWGKRNAEPFSGGPLKSSILAFSVDLGDEDELPAFYHEVRSYKSRLLKTIRPATKRRVREPEDPGPELEALLLLAAFRRRRSIVALRSLLPRYLPPPAEGETMNERIDRFLGRFEERGYLLRVEGGSYWMSRKVRDWIYALVQKGTRGDVLREELAAGRLPQPAVLDRIAMLATVHDHIADYYLSSLYAASQDLQALLEHIYHRASGLRYLTKLDRCLLLHAERGSAPALPAAWRRLDQIDRCDGSAPDETRVTRLRQSRLRSLRYVLEREREHLLSGVAADTLVDWVDWMQAQDVPRFQVAFCLDKTALGVENARRTVFERPDRPCDMEREKEIAAEVRCLWEQLDDLKASVLRDRLDVQACTELRAVQIHQLLRDSAPASFPPLSQPASAWLDQNRDVILERALAADVQIPIRRKIVKYLCDIWAVRRGIRDHDGAAVLQDMVDRIVGPHRPRIESSSDICAMELRRLRHSAEQLIASGSRKVRGHSLEGHRQVEKRWRQALDLCKQGLRVVEWSPGEDYFRQRSSFHSLHGRAATLLGDFKTAHQELDLARSGLVPKVGADREMVAAGLLYLAECLLLRADHVLSECCERKLQEKHRQRKDRDTLSAEGRLCLLGERARILPGEHRERAIELRGAMALWLGFAAGEAQEREAWPREIYERRKQDAGLGDALERWERQWSRKQVERALAGLRMRPAWPEDLAEAHRLSLAHWAPARIAALDGKWGEELEMAMERARRRLVRAEEALDQAEVTLTDARRNVEWWIFLYELRAQLRVERLLLQSTERLKVKEEPGAREEEREEEKARFIARLISDLTGGLRAIRQGLDAMDAAGVPRQKNPRVRRLVRFWVELMVCSAYLTREIECATRRAGGNDSHLDGNQRLRWEVLWKRWVSHCNSAGFSKLLGAADVFQKFDEVTLDPNGYSGGPAGRAFILSSIKKCLRSGGITALLERLG